jgi:Haem-binding uptake, Tiki superfamily, ChaN
METRAHDPVGAHAAAALALCAAALSALAAACGGAASTGARGPSEVRGVEAASLPFRVLRARGGQEISWEAFLGELGRAGAICVGENHRNPHDHWAQLHLIDELTQRNRKAGVATALGMEMFQRPFQGVLDDFAARRIDEAALLSRSGWKDRWGFEWSLYRPMVVLARDRGAELLALNAPRELTRKVSRRGLDRLEAGERGRLPELVLDDAEHRAWWDAIMEEMGAGHGHGQSTGESPHGEDGDEAEEPDQADGEGEGDHQQEAGSTSKGKGKDKQKEKKGGKDGDDPDEEAEDEEEEEADAKAAGERIYTAQVLWDESMADGASTWLAAGKDAKDGAGKPPRRQIVILAGNGHCHESAIVRRIERRGAATAVSVRPIIDDGEGNVASLLAEPENDYLFVMTPPGR